MKKFLAVTLCATLLASCGTQTTADNFQSLYNANVKAQVAKMSDFYKTLYGAQKETTGQISGGAIFVDQNATNNATFSSNYTAFAGGTPNSLVTFESPKGAVEQSAAQSGAEAPKNTISVTADKLEAISGIASFIKFDKLNIDSKSSSVDVQNQAQQEVADVMKKLEPFAGKWIALDDAANTDESLKILQKISTLKASDIEKYLTTYPVLSTTGAVASDGTKRTYQVSLDKTQLTNLFAAAAKDVTGKEVTEQEKAQALKNLEGTEMTGSITYDTKDALYSDSKFTIVTKDSPVSLQVNSLHNNGNTTVSIAGVQAGKEMGRLDFNSTGKDKNSDFNGKVSVSMDGNSSMEVAKFDGKVENLILKNFNLEGSAMGMGGAKVTYTYRDKLLASATVQGKEMFNLQNTYTGDNFSGKASLQGKEIANWTAEYNKDVLTALRASVEDVMAMQTGTGTNAGKKLFEMDLKKQEGSDMVSGKATAMVEGKPVSLDLSLQVEAEKYGFLVQNILIGGDANVSPIKKIEMFLTAKRRDANKVIEIPTTNVVPVSEVQAALDGNSTGSTIEPTPLPSDATVSGATAQ